MLKQYIFSSIHPTMAFDLTILKRCSHRGAGEARREKRCANHRVSASLSCPLLLKSAIFVAFWIELLENTAGESRREQERSSCEAVMPKSDPNHSTRTHILNNIRFLFYFIILYNIMTLITSQHKKHFTSMVIYIYISSSNVFEIHTHFSFCFCNIVYFKPASNNSSSSSHIHQKQCTNNHHHHHHHHHLQDNLLNLCVVFETIIILFVTIL